MIKALSTTTLAFAVMASPAAMADTSAFDQQMQPILEQYLKIQVALAADKSAGVKAAANEIGKLSGKLKPEAVTGEHKEHFKQLPAKIKAGAEGVAAAKDIKAAREAFKGMSKPMAMWATMSKPGGVSVAFCSMTKGSWLQRGEAIRNPYYGAEMLTCGEIVSQGQPAAGAATAHGQHGGGGSH